MGRITFDRNVRVIVNQAIYFIKRGFGIMTTKKNDAVSLKQQLNEVFSYFVPTKMANQTIPLNCEAKKWGQIPSKE